MKYNNKNQIYIFLIIIIICSFFLFNKLVAPIEEPFIGYLNGKRHELSRNIRYRSQYTKKYFDNYFRKIKNFFKSN